MYGRGSQTLEEVVGRLLTEKKQTLALDRILHRRPDCNLLTNVPGVQIILIGGWFSYSNGAKISLLDVSPNIIEQHGAVSAETAIAMAEGVRWVAQTSYGLAVTGIAGPQAERQRNPWG